MWSKIIGLTVLVAVLTLGLVSACGKSSVTDASCSTSLPCSVSTNITE